ncbi:MAG: hypothetical protein QW379_06190 [Thermoplasmata archaeon]
MKQKVTRLEWRRKQREVLILAREGIPPNQSGAPRISPRVKVRN